MCALKLEDARLTLVSSRTSSSILFAQDVESPGDAFCICAVSGGGEGGWKVRQELQGLLLVTMSWKLFLRATAVHGNLSPYRSVQKDCTASISFTLHISACDEKVSCIVLLDPFLCSWYSDVKWFISKRLCATVALRKWIIWSGRINCLCC